MYSTPFKGVKRQFMKNIYILYNVLYNKQPEQFSQILSQFLDEISDEDIQNYNTFDNLENFSRIWMIIKNYDLGDLAVKFIKN